MKTLITVRMLIVLITVLLSNRAVYAGNIFIENYEKGMNYAVQGNLINAEKEFKKALSIAPYSGSIEISLNAIKEISDKKLKIEAAVYFFRGGLYANKGKYKLAIENYTKSLDIESNFSNAYLSRGLAHKKNKQYGLAMNDYNKVIAIDPKQVSAYSNRGALYRIKGQYSMAISDYKKSIELDPEYVGAYYNLGLIYHRYIKQYDLALKFYSKAIYLNPMFADAYFNRGHIYLIKLKDKAKGCSDFSKACKLGECENYRKAKRYGFCY